jgi:hypothetical protein
MRGGEGGIPIRTLSRLGLQPQVGPEKAASPTRPGKGLEGIDEAEGNATDRVGSSPPPERQSISPRAKRQSRWTSSGRQVALRHCSSAARIGPPARHIGAWPLFAHSGRLESTSSRHSRSQSCGARLGQGKPHAHGLRQGRRRAFAVGWAHPIFGRVTRPDTRLTFIVTLVTASIFRGVILVISQGLQMSGLPRESLAKANAPSAAEEDAPIRDNLVSHLCLSNQEGALT